MISRRLTAFVAVMVTLLALAAGPAAADDDPNVLPEKLSVTIGFHVIALRDIDVRTGTFYADFYYWMVRKKIGDPAKDKLVETLEFMNGDVEGTATPVEDKDIGDRRYTCWHAHGTFHFKPDLRYYPFDRQQLEIQVENPDVERELLIYADDTGSYERSHEQARAGLDPGVTVFQYDISGVERAESPSTYHTDFGDPKSQKAESVYSRFTMRVNLERRFVGYFFKIMLPLLVIFGMAYLVFWLPAKEIGSATTLAITALLSCIAFQISVGQTLPEVGYLITSDKFFIVTYLLIFMTLIQSIWTYRLGESGRGAEADLWDRRSRVLYPIAIVGGFTALFAQALLASGG